MERPVVGICVDHVDHFPRPDRDRSYFKLYPSYVDSVIRAGATPLVIPMADDIDALRPLLNLVHGVLFVGGDDYPAEWFGKQTLDCETPVTDTRATFDRAFTDLLLNETRLPILGVCAGLQMMVIATGGSLIQDLPPSELQHRSDPQGYREHALSIAPDSILARAVGTTETTVNSLHHQAVENAGPIMRAVAWAPDGVIEACEIPDHPFRVGVQWHPERMDESADMQTLWRSFVTACETHRLTKGATLDAI